MRIRTPFAIGATALALAAGGFVATTAETASSAAPTKSYAWGLAVNGEGKQPYVESTDGSTQTNPDATLPANPLVEGTIAKFQAGDDMASIELADLTVGSATQQLPQEFTDGITQLQQACEPGGATRRWTAGPAAPGPAGARTPRPTSSCPDGEDLVEFCRTISRR